jgi:proline iminopeptidase
VAAGFTDAFRCILLDQRGCGESRLENYNADTLDVRRFVADIEAVRKRLDVEKIGLFGHSWGAMLVLYYAAIHPQRVAAQVLVGTGPLTPEMSAVAEANILKHLQAYERADYERLSAARRAAIEASDLQKQIELHQFRTTTYTTRAWFYNPDVRDRFNQEWLANYNYNPYVGHYTMPSARAFPIFERLEGLAMPTLIIQGQQDYTPMSQVYALRDTLANVELVLINQCGHVPWLEQHDVFYQHARLFFEYMLHH